MTGGTDTVDAAPRAGAGPSGPPPRPGPAHAPAVEAHRLIGDRRSAALVLPDATIDWWCAPAFDSPPLLWWLLDPDGGVARWRGARMFRRDDRPAGPATRTTVHVAGGRVELWDGMVPGRDGAGSCLVRLARAVDGPVTVTHELCLGGLDAPPATWDARGRARVGDVVASVAGGSSSVDGRWLRTRVAAVPDRWRGLAVTVDGEVPAAEDDPAPELADALRRAEAAVARMVRRARLPHHHPERARDALLVLDACTDERTGAVVASPTTSLPEVVGGRAQWDYRYTWLRDSSHAASVAALLGHGRTATRYLDFVRAMAGPGGVPATPFTDVRGGTPPPERELDARGWAGSVPVRAGNDARHQRQYDALGLLVQAVSVHVQVGGRLDEGTWELVRSVADHLAGNLPEETNGIWELRECLPLVNADLSRWLALDVALWLARLRRPFTRRRHWKRARDEARRRVLAAQRDDGSLPQAYRGGAHSDASCLVVPVFALLSRRDRRAHRLVDAVRRDLGAGPFLYRFPPEGPDGREGAFLPVSWWLVTALAVLGRYHEARELADDMCAQLPRLMAEEIDPETGRSLGNTPLVWSHMEAARTMYVLDAARVRHRWGPVGLAAWRAGRYVLLRWFTDTSPAAARP